MPVFECVPPEFECPDCGTLWITDSMNLYVYCENEGCNGEGEAYATPCYCDDCERDEMDKTCDECGGLKANCRTYAGDFEWYCADAGLSEE